MGIYVAIFRYMYMGDLCTVQEFYCNNILFTATKRKQKRTGRLDLVSKLEALKTERAQDQSLTDSTREANFSTLAKCLLPIESDLFNLSK